MSVGLEPVFSGDEVFFRQFPVHRACRDGDISALVSLLQQLSNQGHLTTEDSCYGWTPLHWAAHYGQLECLAHLVQMGCEVNMVTSRFNQTPTHTAAFGGHPHCVVWLTQAGADINKQDCVGEAPIHKAARSGSLECIQVLLIAGAKPHLRNASGQTAADLAHVHGFHDCFCFISNAGTHLQQLSELHVNCVQRGDSSPCSQGLLSRKRQLTAIEACHMKKARRADAVLVQIQSSSGEEVESMNLELNSENNIKAVLSGHHHTQPSNALGNTELPTSPTSPPSPPANQHAGEESSQHTSAEMCGSLHLTSSPGSTVSHQPEWWRLMGAESVDFLHYGHYHGFGDTAEDLSDSSHLVCSSRTKAEESFKQPLASTLHFSSGS
ncbi:ankyrin repeat domain-containing protein 10a [Leuresthes tenuis]|uniref:ankyrin repeat domain-containing protein 10a n=1 Tax=Leuresthes tenuis TaxID=355514 RepID=UPI003B511061